MLFTTRSLLRTVQRLPAVRAIHGEARTVSPSRTALGLTAGFGAAFLAFEAYSNTAACDAEQAQRDDPTRPPSGAKVDRSGEQSRVNPLEDLKAQGFDVDPKADKDKYITLAEVAQHHLAHDNWVVVDGKVFE